MAGVFLQLLAIFLVVAIGYVAGRLRWLGDEREGADPARTLSSAALYIFIPALLFRTTSTQPLDRLPWSTLAAYFVPLLALMLVVYAGHRVWARTAPPAAPGVRAISIGFGNTVQVGIPVASALFGEAGLALHVTIVSLHSLLILTAVTALTELDLARHRAREHGAQHLGVTLARTVRNTIVHPVVLPVVAGVACNLAGLALPPLLDGVLALLGTAVVPLCLVLIGMSLAYYGLPPKLGAAVAVATVKLVVVPALVLAVAHWGFGLSGMPLQVLVLCAALPVGSNALIFAQRYQTLSVEVTAAIVLSTCAYVATAPAWLAAVRAVTG